MVRPSPLRNTCELPDDILRIVDKLIVNRCGEDPQSYMFTEDIIGYVMPGQGYRLCAERLVSLNTECTGATLATESDVPPPHVRLRGVWNPVEEIDSDNANIFGGLGTLILPKIELAIPQAPTSATALAFYGARLLMMDDSIVFETKQNLPITVTHFGPKYVADYLHVEGKGCGSFIEYHDQPHLHMPFEDTASGHFLLGRREGNEYLLSAFSIPYRQAIYTPPYTLHADPYLVGRYLVVYSKPEHYSTVVFRSADGRLVKTSIVQA